MYLKHLVLHLKDNNVANISAQPKTASLVVHPGGGGGRVAHPGTHTTPYQFNTVRHRYR